MSQVLHWNGKDLPKELRKLPAGRYIVEELDETPALSAEDEEGLRQRWPPFARDEVLASRKHAAWFASRTNVFESYSRGGSAAAAPA
jgi:hypothetical protein